MNSACSASSAGHSEMMRRAADSLGSLVLGLLHRSIVLACVCSMGAWAHDGRTGNACEPHGLQCENTLTAGAAGSLSRLLGWQLALTAPKDCQTHVIYARILLQSSGCVALLHSTAGHQHSTAKSSTTGPHQSALQSQHRAMRQLRTQNSCLFLYPHTSPLLHTTFLAIPSHPPWSWWLCRTTTRTTATAGAGRRWGSGAARSWAGPAHEQRWWACKVVLGCSWFGGG